MGNSHSWHTYQMPGHTERSGDDRKPGLPPGITGKDRTTDGIIDLLGNDASRGLALKLPG